MTNARRVLFALAMAATSLIAEGRSLARGYFNLPTTVGQCLGYGVGPGYHADLVLGPVHRAETPTGVVRRIARPVTPRHAPPVVSDFGGMSRFGSPTPTGGFSW